MYDDNDELDRLAAMGMEQEAPAPRSPLTPATKADAQNGGAVSSQALDQLAKSRPDLVEAYRAKMQPSNDGLADAREAQDNGNYGNTAGKLLNDYSNSQKTDVRLGNRMQDLGKAPTVVKADRPEYDPSAINNLTAQGVSRAKDDHAAAEQDFGKELQLGQMNDAAAAKGRLSDPNSPESIHARNVLSNVAPNAAKIPGFATMTAAQAEAAMPELMSRYKLDQADAFHRDEMNSRGSDRKAMLDGKRSDRADAKDAKQDEMNSRKADREAMLDGKRSDRADAKDAKQDDYDSTVKIPGLSVTPGYKPNAAAAAKVRASKTAHDELQNSAAALDEIYARSGTNLVGDDAARQSQIVATMKTKLKDLESLGALSGSDYALLDNQLPDPTSWTENVKGMVGTDRFKAKSDQFKKSLTSSLQSTASNSGYTVDGAASSHGVTTLTAPDGKQYQVPADKVDQAKAKGWK